MIAPPRRTCSLVIAGLLGIAGLSFVACQTTAEEPPKQEKPAGAAATKASAEKKPSPKPSASAAAKPRRKIAALPVATVPVSADDPLKGKFTLQDATRGLTGTGNLVAEIKTDLGDLKCELYQDKAPISVANFVGLARGLRPWKNPQGKWMKQPGYDGTTFHRVIKGFMIQGGDPAGTGAGEPGYVIPDEIWEDSYHDRRGLLCMANRGKNTNAMQFFITDGPAVWLDGGYTIFGSCGPDSVIEALANVPKTGEKPTSPPKIKKIEIKLEPKAASDAAPIGSAAPGSSALPASSAAPSGSASVGAPATTAPLKAGEVPGPGGVRGDPEGTKPPTGKTMPPATNPPVKPPTTTTPPIVPPKTQ